MQHIHAQIVGSATKLLYQLSLIKEEPGGGLVWVDGKVTHDSPSSQLHGRMLQSSSRSRSEEI